MSDDYRDLVIRDLGDGEADLREKNRDQREAIRQLVDLVADVWFDLQVARKAYQREYLLRVHADATVDRLQRQLAQLRSRVAVGTPPATTPNLSEGLIS